MERGIERPFIEEGRKKRKEIIKITGFLKLHEAKFSPRPRLGSRNAARKTHPKFLQQCDTSGLTQS